MPLKSLYVLQRNKLSMELIVYCYYFNAITRNFTFKCVIHGSGNAQFGFVLRISIKKHDQHMIYTLYKPKRRGYALVYDVLAEGLTTILPVFHTYEVCNSLRPCRILLGGTQDSDSCSRGIAPHSESRCRRGARCSTPWMGRPVSCRVVCCVIASTARQWKCCVCPTLYRVAL